MKRLVISMAMFWGLLFLGPSSMAELLVNDNFEGRQVDWGRQTGVAKNIQIMDTSFARMGTKALRIQVHKDDPWVAGGPRSEILQPRRLGAWKDGDEYWVSASVLFPQDYEDDPMQEIFWQIHAAKRQRGASNRAAVPFFMQSVADKILIRGKGIDTIEIEKTKGKWMDFVVHHRWSSRGSGVTQVYVNGSLLVDGQGISNMIANDQLYWKLGMYKSGWKMGGDAKSSVSQRELWFDEVKIGSANSNYSEMALTESLRVDNTPGEMADNTPAEMADGTPGEMEALKDRIAILEAKFAALEAKLDSIRRKRQ